MNTDEAKMLEVALKTVSRRDAAAGLKADYEFFQAVPMRPGPTRKIGRVHGAEIVGRLTVKLYRQIGVIEHPLDPKSLYTNEFAEGPDPVTTNQMRPLIELAGVIEGVRERPRRRSRARRHRSHG